MLTIDDIRTLSAVNALESSHRRKSRRALLRVLRQHPDPHPVVQKFISRLETCGRTVVMECRRDPTGALHWVEISPDEPSRGLRRDTFLVGCGHPTCPHCSQKWTEDEARTAWENIALIIGKPKRRDFTFIRISIITTSLGEDLRPFRDRFKRKLRHVLSKHLPDAIVVGGFHINRSGEDAHLHLHAWVQSRMGSNAVGEVLRRAFPGSNEVHWEPMKQQRSIQREFEHVVKYLSDQKLLIEGQGRKTPELLHDWICTLETLGGTGRKGLRFTKGLSGCSKSLQEPLRNSVSRQQDGDTYCGTEPTRY